MAAHSRVLAWRIPMGRGAWRATGHAVAESNTAERQTLSPSSVKPEKECLEASCRKGTQNG